MLKENVILTLANGAVVKMVPIVDSPPDSCKECWADLTGNCNRIRDALEEYEEENRQPGEAPVDCLKGYVWARVDPLHLDLLKVKELTDDER